MDNNDFCDFIVGKATEIRNSLIDNSDYTFNKIDAILPPLPPFFGTDEIKLIIIGQDPTIRNPIQRKKISVTLNLNIKGVLLNYVEHKICVGLGIFLQNIYATNLFKYFYSQPPSTTREVLSKQLLPNLNLLLEELSQFQNAQIVTLGEPVLELLAIDPELKKVRFFWDYNQETKKTNGIFKLCPAGKNKLGRDIYPFPHQPSMQKTFYHDTLTDYLSFMKCNL